MELSGMHFSIIPESSGIELLNVNDTTQYIKVVKMYFSFNAEPNAVVPKLSLQGPLLGSDSNFI